MMKGLFYSQYALISDLPTLSLSLCKRLIQEIDIDFLYGSPAPRPLLIDAHFHQLNMPAFTINFAPNPDVQDPAHLQQINAQHQRRIDFLEKEVKPPYDFLMTEIFPFGKVFLREEIIFLRNLLKSRHPDCRIICSLPDVVEIVKPSFREKALLLFQELYDAVFVHADPQIIRLEESFPAAANFSDKIIYTGFIPNGLEPAPQDTKRQKRILIPISGQFFGEELVRAVLPLIAHFSDYEFVFVLPRNAPPFLEEILRAWSRHHASSAIQILTPQKSLEKLLRESAFSISLANAHLIDMAYTRTPGIAFAAGSPMQLVRLQRFASKGLVKQITPNDLVPDHLQGLIEEALSIPNPDHQIDMNGAENTLKLLKKTQQV